MVALELLPDGLHAHAGDLADDVHRHLAGGADVGVALFAADVGGHHVVGACDLVENFLDRHGDGLAVVQRVLDGGGRHADAGGDALQHIVGVQFFDRALQLADVLLEVVGDVLRHIVGQVQIQQLRFALDDGDAGLKIGRLDVGGQTPLKAGAQTLLQTLDFLGGAVGRDNDLPPVVVQGVEGVEELFLRGFLARQELDIVDQQHVRLPVFLAELLGRGGFYGGDDLVGKHLAVHIHDVEIGVVLFDFDLNGVEQVRLAQTRRTVDEQRVVRTAGVGGNRLRGGVGKLVAGTLDEVFKGEIVSSAGQGTFVQLGLFFFALVLFGGDEQHLNVKAQHRLEGVF